MAGSPDRGGHNIESYSEPLLSDHIAAVIL